MKIEWQVEVDNLEPQLPLLMQTAADCALAAREIVSPCGISLRLTGDEEIRRVNKAFRGVDRATDVLSFPMTPARPGHELREGCQALRRAFDPEAGCAWLGDIVISMPRVRSQAEAYGSGLAREAAYLLVHGICHLMGYDHMTETDRREMRRMEEKAMEMGGLAQAEAGCVSKEALMALARSALERAYVPYSRFKVGAALLCRDGRVFQGCNVENASYGATNCAERTAVFKAVSEGAKEFEAIAIACEHTRPSPCGICRQVLNEFAPEIKIYLTWDGDKVIETSLPELLPMSFGPKDLAPKAE